MTPLRPLATTGGLVAGESWAVTVRALPSATGPDLPAPGSTSTGYDDSVTYWLDDGLEQVDLEVSLILADGMVWAQAAAGPTARAGGEAAYFQHKFEARAPATGRGPAGRRGTPPSTLRLRISARRKPLPPPGAEQAAS